MTKRIVGLAAATVMSAGLVLAGTAAPATANPGGDYMYVGYQEDGQGGYIYEYRDGNGRGAWSDKWQGIAWDGVSYWNVQ